MMFQELPLFQRPAGGYCSKLYLQLAAVNKVRLRRMSHLSCERILHKLASSRVPLGSCQRAQRLC